MVLDKNESFIDLTRVNLMWLCINFDAVDYLKKHKGAY